MIMNPRKQAAVDFVTRQLSTASALARETRNDTVEKQAVSYGYAVATMENAAAILSELENL